MWKSIGDLVSRAGEALGIKTPEIFEGGLPEIPEVGALSDSVTGAADAVGGQAGDVASTATGIGDTVAGAAGQAVDEASSAVDRPTDA